MLKDLELFKQLEKEIGKELIEIDIDRIDKDIKNGFSVNEKGEVIGLNLDKIRLVHPPDILSKFRHLKKLFLYDTQIRDISFLRELSSLISLDLSSNQITDYYFLKTLPNLSSLYLSDNTIVDISFLKGMNQLSILGLKNNSLMDISIFESLSHLTSLDLSGNLITDISSLRFMDKLVTLDLSRNRVYDISSLQYLTLLESLDLSGNQITDFSILKNLARLNNLFLTYNGIKDISFIRNLSNLKSLDLSHNGITDISSIQNLIDLKSLSLSNNTITDISVLKNLNHLNNVDLIDNKIRDIPLEVAAGEMKLDVDSDEASGYGIYLRGNPLETPPLEIIRKGKEAIQVYFSELGKGKKLPLNEVKLLLVGDGGAGKTSLVRQIKGKTFDPNEAQTDGIDIEPWIIKKGDQEITVHMWDFGGQEIMHATHQFFLSRRSLYILVLDGRKDEKTEYWLKHIESFGGDSPVLVVLNKIDENPAFDVNRKFLREKYKNIKGFYQVSCKTQKGMKLFINALEEELSQIEVIKSTWSESWFNVKKQLENMQEHFITYKEYREICVLEKIAEKPSQETLLDFLNDLGVVLHFRDLELEDTHVLEPEWVTRAVYKIINSEKLANEKGILKLNLLDDVLKKEDKDDYYYPPDKYRYIIELMKKFELCYKLDSEHVLIPDLLDVEECNFDFEYPIALKFIIEYDFLPRSVIPRFIVKMHKDIKMAQDNKKKLQWRTGVILEDKSFQSTAVVKVDERDRKIFVYVNGEQRRDYFAVIRKTLRDINGSFEKLETKELVPLPDDDKITVEYEELIGHERMGETFITVGKLRKKYRVGELLNGLEKPEERGKSENIIPPAETDKPLPLPPANVPGPQPEKGKKWYKKISKLWEIIIGIGIILALLAALIQIIDWWNKSK